VAPAAVMHGVRRSPCPALDGARRAARATMRRGYARGARLGHPLREACRRPIPHPVAESRPQSPVHAGRAGVSRSGGGRRARHASVPQSAGVGGHHAPRSRPSARSSGQRRTTTGGASHKGAVMLTIADRAAWRRPATEAVAVTHEASRWYAAQGMIMAAHIIRGAASDAAGSFAPVSARDLPALRHIRRRGLATGPVA